MSDNYFCFILLVYEETREGGYNIKFSMVGWKGKNSLRAYVPKNERVHYLRLIGGDTSKYEKNKFEERREKNGNEDGETEKEPITENTVG